MWIYVGDLAVYNDSGRSLKFYSRERECKPKLVSPYPEGISAYIPGDWEAHLDELYRRIPEHRNERIRIWQEKNAKEKLEVKRKQIEKEKKRFGL